MTDFTPPEWELATHSVHSGEPHQKAHGALATPISCTSTYTFRDTDELRDHFEGRLNREEYGRYGNPTVRIAEQKLAALDGAEDTAVFASGMAAITTTLLAMVRSGQHVILTSDCYRRTRQFVTTVLPRFGVESSVVDPDDYDGLAQAIRPGITRLIIAESPTNPYLRCLDIPRVAEITKQHRGMKFIVDSTFASPVNQRPLALGADLVFHSCTKYLGGHNDLLGGAVSGRSGLIGALREFRGVLGGILDAHSAYLLIRGLKTLVLRVNSQNEAALELARWLEAQPQVSRVFYPGLKSHPDHDVATQTMSGFGGVITFEVLGDVDSTAKFIDSCTIPKIAPSLGGVESLIEQPALMSYYELTSDQRAEIGIGDNLVRLSVGIEAVSDLLHDLENALSVL
jgi:cystathionine gamma-synthase